MQKIQAIFPPDRVDAIRQALAAAGFSRFELTPIAEREGLQGPEVELTVIVDDADVERALDTILRVSAASASGEGVLLLPVDRRAAGASPAQRAPISTGQVPRTWSWRPGSR